MVYRAKCLEKACKYQWNSRLGTPPKECPKCRSKLIESTPM